MNCVIEHLDYLIRRHNCVVVPGWGAFIVHRRPAFFDVMSGVMYPPERDITFNAAVAHDDGLLVSSVARRNRISFENASKIVTGEIEAMRHQIECDGEISFGGIGRFIAQSAGTPLFEISSRYKQNASAYLSPIEIAPVIEQAREEEILRSIRDHGRRSHLRRIGLKAAKVAASLAVVATVAVFLLTPVISNRNDNLASVANMTSRSSQTAILPGVNDNEHVLYIQVPDEERQQSSNMDASAAVPVSETLNTIAESPKSTPADINVTTRFDETDRYCLVVASLPSMDLADKFIRESGEAPLGILVQDGKYRVYAATGSTSGEALAQKNVAGIESRYPDAWVCRRK